MRWKTSIDITVHVEAIEHKVDLVGQDQAALVLVVETEGIAKLQRPVVLSLGVPKDRELLERYEAVAFEV